VLVKFLPPEKTVKGAPAINSNPVPGEYETYWSEAQRAAYRELAVVKRLDVKAGMGYAADSIEDYFNVLRQFCKELPEAAGVVRADVGEGNWKDYALRLHSYKGTLAMMGCAALSADAKALEGASKAGGDENILFCKKETPAFLAGLEQFGADLRGTSLFKIDVKEKTLVDMADVRARLRALSQACAELKSADALAIAADVKGFRLAEEVAGLDAKLEEVCALVSSFRFSEACAKIAGLL
jgi:HPt (histidine-containing phosphotransfer) domain-containing protein